PSGQAQRAAKGRDQGPLQDTQQSRLGGSGSLRLTCDGGGGGPALGTQRGHSRWASGERCTVVTVAPREPWPAHSGSTALRTVGTRVRGEVEGGEIRLVVVRYIGLLSWLDRTP